MWLQYTRIFTHMCTASPTRVHQAWSIQPQITTAQYFKMEAEQQWKKTNAHLNQYCKRQQEWPEQWMETYTCNRKFWKGEPEVEVCKHNFTTTRQCTMQWTTAPKCKISSDQEHQNQLHYSKYTVARKHEKGYNSSLVTTSQSSAAIVNKCKTMFKCRHQWQYNYNGNSMQL